MKRIFIFLFAALALSYVQAQTSGKCGDNLTWSLDEGTGVLTIAGEGAMYNYDNSRNSAPWYSYRANIKSILIESGVTSIGSYAFNYCGSARSIISNISADKLFSVSSDAFNGVDKYTCSLYVSIGSKETYAATDSWAEFNNIIEFNRNNKCGDNLYWTLDEGTGVLAILGDGVMYDYSINNSPWYALRDNINSVVVENTVTSIGSYAFSGCSALKAIKIPESITSIGDFAFEGCNSLANIISLISADKLFPFDSDAFLDVDKENCTLYVPKGAKVEYAITDEWREFKKIREFKINDICGTNLYYSFDEETHVLTIFGCGKMYSYGGSRFAPWVSLNMTTLVITSGVTDIGEYAFRDSKSLKDVIIHKGLKNIGYRAFMYVFYLANIVIPEGVTSIGEEAFYDCSNLTNIEIPEGVTRIAPRTFKYCKALCSIKIPSSVTSIGNEAFRGCTSLVDVKLSEGLKCFDGTAFEDCTSLKTISIPSSVTTIGGGTFWKCSSLKSVVIPEGVTTIEGLAFEDCTSLTSVEIPSTVTEIGTWVFGGCTALESITSYIPANKLFEPGYATFYRVDKDYCVLKVPAGAKSTYAATAQWKDFKNIIEMQEVVNIVDGVPYTATEVKENVEVVYSRTFGNTNWQAWYVPFAIDCEQLSDDFDVAKINDIHQYDTDRNGIMDKTELEVVKLHGGTLKANYPYLVRAKVAGEKSITVSDATLEAANNTVIDCSSVKLKYYFAGTCAGVSGQEMFDGKYYALSSGALMQAADNSAALKPLRWYMRIENRGEAVSAGVIRIRVLGDDTTDVREVETEPRGEAVYYDLSGRRVENPTRGIYIVNGKKVYIK